MGEKEGKIMKKITGESIIKLQKNSLFLWSFDLLLMCGEKSNCN